MQTLRQQKLLALIKAGVRNEVLDLSSRGHLLLELKQDQAYLLQASGRFIEQTALTGLYNEDDASQVADLYIRELVAGIEQDLEHSPVAMGKNISSESVRPSVTAPAPSAPSSLLQDLDDPMLDDTPALAENFTSTPSPSLMSPNGSACLQPTTLPGSNPTSAPQPLATQPDVDQSGTALSYPTSANESRAVGALIPVSRVPGATLFPSQTLQSSTSRHCPSCGANGRKSPKSSSTPDNSNDSSDSDIPLRERGKKRPKELNAFNVRIDSLYSDR